MEDGNNLSNHCKDCGCDVGAFDKKNFLITFGHKTLVTLKDFCYFIDVTPLKKKIWAGDILKIDDQEYEILRIGGNCIR